jgi:hypothetical protein
MPRRSATINQSIRHFLLTRRGAAPINPARCHAIILCGTFSNLPESGFINAAIPGRAIWPISGNHRDTRSPPPRPAARHRRAAALCINGKPEGFTRFFSSPAETGRPDVGRRGRQTYPCTSGMLLMDNDSANAFMLVATIRPLYVLMWPIYP